MNWIRYLLLQNTCTSLHVLQCQAASTHLVSTSSCDRILPATSTPSCHAQICSPPNLLTDLCTCLLAYHKWEIGPNFVKMRSLSLSSKMSHSALKNSAQHNKWTTFYFLWQEIYSGMNRQTALLTVNAKVSPIVRPMSSSHALLTGCVPRWINKKRQKTYIHYTKTLSETSLISYKIEICHFWYLKKQFTN